MLQNFGVHLCSALVLLNSVARWCNTVFFNPGSASGCQGFHRNSPKWPGTKFATTVQCGCSNATVSQCPCHLRSPGLRSWR